MGSCCSLRLFKLKTEDQKPNNINRRPHHKVTKLKSKFLLSWVSLIGLSTIWLWNFALRPG